jgi:hypothetical protein
VAVVGQEQQENVSYASFFNNAHKNYDMRNSLFIAVCLLSFLYSCHPSGSTSVIPTSDTTFNGSYFKIAYNGRLYNVKGAVVNTTTYASISSSVPATGTLLITIQTIGGVYGLAPSYVNLVGTGTGTYQFSPTLAGSTVINQYTPTVVIYIDTSGTANITHNGSDYIEGTFSTTLNGSGFSYPATGSFKVYH